MKDKEIYALLSIVAFVEHPSRGFQWAEPLHGKKLSVELVNGYLEIIGRFPIYSEEDSPGDLIRNYETSPENAFAKAGIPPPHLLFANADTDEKLLAFTERYGPVVAKHFEHGILLKKIHRVPGFLVAHQDLQELRNEQTIFRAALTLGQQFEQKHFDEEHARKQLEIIARGVKDWPQQWRREKVLRKADPPWNLSDESVKQITALSVAMGPIPFAQYPTVIDSRIVLCALLNAFPSTVFPNRLSMHSNISYGIRPLLYSLLRRQILFPREFAACKNTLCRNFFQIERAGQEYCNSTCSRQQRQRDYWHKVGKPARKKKIKKSKKNAQ